MHILMNVHQYSTYTYVRSRLAFGAPFQVLASFVFVFSEIQARKCSHHDAALGDNKKSTPCLSYNKQ